MASFEAAIGTILAHEGGYCIDNADPGGETNFGITKRTYPDLNIWALTEDEAKKIYLRDWWNANRWAEFDNQAVATKVFDMAVNMGCSAAHKLLQRALGDCGKPVLVDGHLGNTTIRAVNACDALSLLEALKQRSSEHYHEIVAHRPESEKFLKGWLARANA